MSFQELFSLAIKALRANLMRTLLTMLGIVIGIASVITIISLGQGATRSITDQISSFGTNLLQVIPGSQSFSGKSATAGTRTDTLTMDDAQAITKLANIDLVSPAIAQSVQISANNQSQMANILGVQENYFSINTLVPSYGGFFNDDDNNSMSRVAFIGPEISKNMFGENTNPVGQTLSINNKNFKVVGVSQPKGSIGLSNPDKNVYIPIKTGSKLIFGRDYLTIALIRIKDTNLMQITMDDIKQTLLSRHKITDATQADFTIYSSKDALNILGTVTNLLTIMLAGIAGISLLVGGIGIMNIMLVTVTERTKEIGLLKAIGAKNKAILSQILVESLVLTTMGGIVGIVIGVSMSYLVSKIANIPFVVLPSSIFLAVGVSSIVGIIFGLYPANRAAKLNPIDALKYE
ncbi:MAG: ABC transporter permease [Candidatus Berkelbacteria bacterium]